MSVSLYRKYRPARFADIIGQDHVARTLVNAIKNDRVSHAYLFTGPRGTGKTSTAKILAMALNCDAGEGKATPEPDGTCPHCLAIRRGSAMDVVEMDAASNRGIDDIRDLRDKVHFSPVEGRMKVYIVDEVHMLTPEAFNALLKTLEEPPTHAVFVLATTEPHKVPATILSRCQRFDFRRPSVVEVVGVLRTIAAQEAIEVPEASLTVIARAAGGSFRDAIGILDQLSTYSGGKISVQETLDILGVVHHDLLFEIVDLVHDHDTQAALLFVERLSRGATDYGQFMKDLLGHLRDLYVVKHTEETPASIALTDDQLITLRSQAGRVSTSRLVTFIDLLGEALRAVRQGSDARLELELTLIKMTAFGPGGQARSERAAAHVADAAGMPSPAVPSASAAPAVSLGVRAPVRPTVSDVTALSTEQALGPEEGPAAAQTPPTAGRTRIEGTPVKEAVLSQPPSGSSTLQPDGGRKVKARQPAPAPATEQRAPEASDRPSATGPSPQPSVGQPEYEDESAAARPEIKPGTEPAAEPGAVPASEPRTEPAATSTVHPDVEHLRRAWPLVLEAIKRRQAGLAAVLGEGRPHALQDDELVIRFPAGYNFQANQMTRGDNPRVIADALREVTGKDLRITAHIAADSEPQPAREEEGARILSKDELIRVLKQEFDAQDIEDGPVR